MATRKALTAKDAKYAKEEGILNYFSDFATFASVAVNTLFLSEHIQR